MKTDDRVHPRDRFFPCLLSRLIDQEPEARKERNPQMMTAEQLRQDVMRNLEMVFNSRSRLSDAELSCSPDMIRSVLGFGLSDFCGISVDAEIREEMREKIRCQIQYFEPRIRRDTLSVELNPCTDRAKELSFTISGTIYVAPIKEEILFSSKLDLETGIVSISSQKARIEHE